MTDTGLITFPPQGQWIPNLEQVTETGRALLAVAGAVLDYYGRGEDYERRVLQHGDTPQVLSGQAQVLVSCLGMFPGRAGQEQFQFAEGALGKLAQRFGRYLVTVARPWPTAKGGMVAQLPDADATEGAATDLDTDALLVFEAFRSVALGGTKAPVAPLAQDNILVASMSPMGPQGGVAGWRITVEVQF